MRGDKLAYAVVITAAALLGATYWQYTVAMQVHQGIVAANLQAFYKADSGLALNFTRIAWTYARTMLMQWAGIAGTAAGLLWVRRQGIEE